MDDDAVVGRELPVNVKNETPNDEDNAQAAADGLPPPKKKQKRNKPTLSCVECVERKTKVSRRRRGGRSRAPCRAFPQMICTLLICFHPVFLAPARAGIPRRLYLCTYMPRASCLVHVHMDEICLPVLTTTH